MKIRFLIIALFMGQMVFAQPDNHERVLGTKCSIVPPEGFIPATQFYGLMDTVTDASIRIEEMPVPFQDYVNEFESFIERIHELTLIEKKEIDFNRSKALLFSVRQDLFDTTIYSTSLVFGDDDETVFVKGNYPENDEKIREKIKNALLSTQYNTLLNDNPTEAANFTVDLTGTEFKCVKFESGSLVFSTDERIVTKGPTIRIDRSFRSVSSENRKQFAKDRLNNLQEGDHLIVRDIKAITIDHLDGYEILAEGPLSGTEIITVYQLVLFTESSGYYLFVGQCEKDADRYTEVFRKIAMTFKRK